jgi:hypothetical protein
MRRVTIVGGGQAGLWLAVALLKKGYRVRLVQNRSAADIRAGRVLSTQCIFATARSEERAMGLDLWDSAAPAIHGMRIQVAAPDGSGAKAIGFEGRLAAPAQSVDQRIKFPKWMEIVGELGGAVEIVDAGISQLDRYTQDSDLVVIASGKGDIARLFERDAARSPYTQPMRALSVVYVHGFKRHDGPLCVTATLVPGVGELFIIPGLTLSGPCDILFFEGVPGGPLDVFDGVTDVEAQLRRMTELIAKLVPWEAHRLGAVMPTDRHAGLAGRVVPTVRGGVGRLPSGRPVLGLADSVILNDPIVGQGSNNALKSARIYLDAIVAHGDRPFDEAWMRETFEAGYARTEASTRWSNMILQPPPEHVVMLLAKAQGKQALADRIANGFDEPATHLELFADPELAAAA